MIHFNLLLKNSPDPKALFCGIKEKWIRHGLTSFRAALLLSMARMRKLGRKLVNSSSGPFCNELSASTQTEKSQWLRAKVLSMRMEAQSSSSSGSRRHIGTRHEGAPEVAAGESTTCLDSVEKFASSKSAGAILLVLQNSNAGWDHILPSILIVMRLLVEEGWRVFCNSMP